MDLAGAASTVVAALLGGAGSPYTAVGHDEVIRMEYEIGLGFKDAFVPIITLADTDSYKRGVSLSEIRWGFYNSADSGSSSGVAHLEFTLHDIAGTTLENFILTKTGQYFIFFKGPTSSGDKWFGDYALYEPDNNSCDLQFSQTQGFTYRFSGRPSARLSSTPLLATSSKITINGLNSENVGHGNTFKDYLEELEVKWNKQLAESPDKAPTAQIKITMDPGIADNDRALKKSPVLTEKENKGQTLNRTGDPGAKILQIEFLPPTPIADIIKTLWQTRFVPAENAPGNPSNNNSQLEATFYKYEGGVSYIDVKCHATTVTDNVPAILPVCIGTDKVCKGFPYRAEMAAINFKGLMNLLAADKHAQQMGTGPMDASQAGQQEQGPVQHTKTHTLDTIQQQENSTAMISMAAGLGGGNNPLFDGWANMGAILNKYRVSDFTIDIDMPYTYAFTPFVHGGLLLDAKLGFGNGAIDYRNGVLLIFFWYTDPHCQEVSLVPSICTEYRITKVQHTIGLSGNTTQVSLSHLNVGRN